MKKKRRRLILIFMILILIAGILFAISRCDFTEEKQEIKVLNEIEGYNYKLEDRDTTLYKDNFLELETALEQEEVDFKTYAELISKLFIIDLYTIDNKVSKYDVGGSEFILTDALVSYEAKVIDTIYKYMSSEELENSLPEVTSIEVTSIEESVFELGEEEHGGYTINLSWDYKKDYGYDKSAIVTVINIDNILYVVEHQSEE